MLSYFVVSCFCFSPPLIYIHCLYKDFIHLQSVSQSVSQVDEHHPILLSVAVVPITSLLPKGYVVVLSFVKSNSCLWRHQESGAC